MREEEQGKDEKVVFERVERRTSYLHSRHSFGKVGKVGKHLLEKRKNAVEERLSGVVEG